jgi:two-component system sensor histidine kinase ChiS
MIDYAFTAKLPTLKMLLTQVAIAVVNAQLYEAMKTAHDQKEKLCKELEEANQFKQQILMNTSHELRTPLSGILGLTEVLLDRITQNSTAYSLPSFPCPSSKSTREIRSPIDDSPGNEETLVTIYNCAKRMRQLVDDLLDVSKLSSGRLSIKEEEVRLDLLMEQVSDLMKPLAESKGLHIKTTLSSLPRVRGDSIRLQQILVNLIGKALLFYSSSYLFLSLSSPSPLFFPSPPYRTAENDCRECDQVYS